MTGNEKKLLAILGGSVGIYFAYLTLDSLHLTPRRQLRERVTQEEARFERLLEDMGKSKATQADWTLQTQRTLSTKRDDAQLVFRDQIAKLIEKHQLESGHTLTPQQQREIKKDSRKGFVELPIQVNLEGKLAAITAFIEDIQKLPYYVSVEKLVLNASAAEQGLAGSAASRDKKGARPGATSKDGPTLRAEMRLTTLVLPKIGDATHVVCDLNKEDNSPALKPRDESASYATVAATNVFRPYADPPPPPPPPPPPVERGTDKPPPPAPAPAPRDSRVLVGTPSLNGEPVAFVRDDDKSKPPTELRLNEAVSDNGKGKLVLVHPKGIVIRVSEQNPAAAKNYFVALGQKLSEREELTPKSHPEVYAMLSRVIMQ